MVQDLVNAKRALLGQSKISVASASKSFSKALRSTAISEGVMIVLFGLRAYVKISYSNSL